jgi:hypothetical protein
MSIVRIHKKQINLISKANDRQLMYNLKFPIENLTVAFRPRTNITNSQNWNKYCNVASTSVSSAVIVSGSAASAPAIYNKESHVISKLELTAHSTILFKSTPAAFFSNYTHLVGTNAPLGCGWYRFNFNLKPGCDHPSGYFNISSSRELYLNYESDESASVLISASNTCDLITIAEVLNILILRDASAYLKYAN